MGLARREHHPEESVSKTEGYIPEAYGRTRGVGGWKLEEGRKYSDPLLLALSEESAQPPQPVYWTHANNHGNWISQKTMGQNYSKDYKQMYPLWVTLTLGMLSLVHTPSWSSRSRISHANIDGHSLLYMEIFPTTSAVATRGLLPPIALGRIEPVS